MSSKRWVSPAATKMQSPGLQWARDHGCEAMPVNRIAPVGLSRRTNTNGRSAMNWILGGASIALPVIPTAVAAAAFVPASSTSI